MPKISQKNGMGVIEYNEQDWLDGLNTTSADNANSKLQGNSIMNNIDPLRDYGYLSASQLAQPVTGNSNIDAFLRNAVNNQNLALLIENGAKIQQLVNLVPSGNISTTSPFPHTVDNSSAWTSFVGNDVVNYYVKVSTSQLLYGFFSGNYIESGTPRWNVGIYAWVANTFEDDFMSAHVTSPLASPYLEDGAGYPHPLVVGDDDILYIGDRNFVHAYDGQTNTFSPAVLTLPQGYIITCFTTTSDITLAIGTYYSTSKQVILGVDTFNRGIAKVWFWNYLDLDPDYARDLRDNYVSELIKWNGTIAAFTTGRQSLSQKGIYQLQALNGNNFQTITNWNQGLPIRGGVDNVGDDLYWNAGGALMSYTKRPDNGRYILNQFAAISDQNPGLLKFFTSSTIIHASSSNTGAISFEYLNGNYNSSSLFRGKVANPDFDALSQGRLTKVTIKFKEQGNFDVSLLFNIILNDIESNFLPVITSVTSNNRVTQISKRADGTPLGTFSSLVPEISWQGNGGVTNAPKIDWVRFEFETINI